MKDAIFRNWEQPDLCMWILTLSAIHGGTFTIGMREDQKPWCPAWYKFHVKACSCTSRRKVILWSCNWFWLCLLFPVPFCSLLIFFPLVKHDFQKHIQISCYVCLLVCLLSPWLSESLFLPEYLLESSSGHTMLGNWYDHPNRFWQFCCY